MARSRKSVPAPIPTGALSAEDATLEQRTQYLLQEIGEEGGFLEQWVVHYLAELLERADDQEATPHARSEARIEIARVTPALWEQQIAREALRVRREVDYWRRRTDTLDSKAEKILAALLKEPDKTADLAKSDLPDIFRAFYTFAELVTRFLGTTSAAERAKRHVTSEAVQSFLQRDEEVQGLQAALARVVPDFAALDPTDLDSVGRLFHQTLLALTRAQLILLTRVAQEEEVVVPRTVRGVRRPKRRQEQ
jgi:hypothetical protein